MSGLLDRLARLFVAPPPDAATPVADPAPEDIAWLPPRPGGSERIGSGSPVLDRAAHPEACAGRTGFGRVARLAVVCAERDARVAGGAAGLALALAERSPAAVVAGWTGEPAGSRAEWPASRPARRAANTLRQRGHEVVVTGRLVRVDLPADEGDAVSVARRVMERVALPTVLVVCGPREAGFERLLAEQDLALVVVRGGGAPELAATAVAGLESLRLPVVVVEMASSAGAAALARSGIALMAPLRTPFLAALQRPGSTGVC